MHFSKVWLLPNVYEGKAFYCSQNKVTQSNSILMRERYKSQKGASFADFGEFDGNYHKENEAAV